MADSPPAISVIVPCYRDPELLSDLLRSLRAQESGGASFEVMVIDSGADDRVAVEAERGAARCIRGRGRLLPGEARNLGVDHAKGAVVAFIDCDCIAEAGWVDALAAGLTGGARAVGGPVSDRTPWYTIASIDNLLQFADFGPARPAGAVTHVPSCNMAMKRDDFLALGGFEHRGQRAGEDVLLTSALDRRWPGGLVFVPSMRVAHLGRRRLGDMLRHHHGFGYVRGALGLHLSEGQRRWGRLAILVPAVIIKRLTYVATRGIRYGRTSPAKTILMLPLLLLGVLAWTIGFRRGLGDFVD
jgi:mycofactocin glycosyltransferase